MCVRVTRHSGWTNVSEAQTLKAQLSGLYFAGLSPQANVTLAWPGNVTVQICALSNNPADVVLAGAGFLPRAYDVYWVGVLAVPWRWCFSLPCEPSHWTVCRHLQHM